MTLTWIPPDTVPENYEINTTCKLLCNNTIFFGDIDVTPSPPFNINDIYPYSQCQFQLTGLYEDENVVLFSEYSATTLLTGKTILFFCLLLLRYLIAPSSSVSNITFSSVTATSIIVSWDEVPCSERNGPITGYHLTYASITSNTSYTVNITGGDNRTYDLTRLVPYTNYAVSIGAYNYEQQGPDGDKVMQRTSQSGI